MTILAFTGLVLSYGNALFSLLFLVWFIFACTLQIYTPHFYVI